MNTEDHLRAHEDAGSRIDVDGVSTFVRQEGEGPTVLCIHGVPVSSYLWRKVLPELSRRGCHAVAYDFPGLGLADRPESFDYSWSGLGSYCLRLIDMLGIDQFHLVVHDVGGPVGFEVAAAIPDRVQSLTILNTLVEVDGFTKPWTMRPFEKKGLGELWLGSMIEAMFVQLMYVQGVSDKTLSTPAEVAGHYRLLKRGDRGKAFLKIMRSFEPTAEKQARYVGAVTSGKFPVQVVWGEDDPALKVETFGAVARRLVGEDKFFRVPGKHFLQETAFEAIAERVAALVHPS